VNTYWNARRSGTYLQTLVKVLEQAVERSNKPHAPGIYCAKLWVDWQAIKRIILLEIQHAVPSINGRLEHGQPHEEVAPPHPRALQMLAQRITRYGRDDHQ